MKEETYDYVGSGMLVGLANPQFYQQVPVEIHAKKAHFIWKNQEDYIQGNVWLDGEKIFGDEETGFTTLFVKAEPSYSCITTTDGDTAGNMFLISKDLKTVLCGVKIEDGYHQNASPVIIRTHAICQYSNKGNSHKRQNFVFTTSIQQS